MATPSDRVYSKSHEWHKTEGETLTLGITQYAVNALTDVTYVEMKPKGFKFKAGENIGTIESVKTTSDIYCACDGEITEVNAALASNPALLNEDCYGKAWLVKIKPSSPIKDCVDQKAYDAAHPA